MRIIVLLLLLLQIPGATPRTILEAEDARTDHPDVLLQALKNPALAALAGRAIGRLERLELAGSVRPLLEDTDPAVRLEALNALGQMNAAFDFQKLLTTEKDIAVRAEIYETIGRIKDPGPGVESALTAGLKESVPQGRAGAARGFEAYYRTHRGTKPSPETVLALRQAFRDNSDAGTRELLLLTLNAAGDKDPATLAAAENDPEPQVRRLAVIQLKQWKEDSSALVRYEALKAAPTCARAASLVHDPSDHVALLAVDLLADHCDSRTIQDIVDNDPNWRKQAHALVSLAKVEPDAARLRLGKFAANPVWQARVYAAEAAKILKADATLAKLLSDPEPNVIIAAMVTPQDAVRALAGSHYGLLYEAARKLKGWDEGRTALPALEEALERLSAQNNANSRDPRMEIMQRIRDFGDAKSTEPLRPLLFDIDPAVAHLASDIIYEKTGIRVAPGTTRYATKPPPAETYIRGLAGATATIRMKEAGPYTIELLADVAPVTVAAFAQLAERGYYNGLTMHRIVPNFVIQGGSPGASEYVGYPDFLRDELSRLSQLRGTLGISTRGRDTGDAQFFVNLVDNFRLDHNYTVFARVIAGMDNVDRIQEGDVIEAVEIHRKP